jgi:alpha-tubulin suppressor-like RCC1 family protein
VSTHICSDGACIRKVTKLGVGSDYACAVINDGRTFCWGEGQPGGGTLPAALAGLPSNDPPTHFGGGYHHSCAALQSGAVYCWGQNRSGQLGNQSTSDSTRAVKVNGLSGSARSVAAGDDHSCALMSDSSIWCWGGNAGGQIGTGTASATELTPKRAAGTLTASAIVTGLGYTCALNNASVRCWGSNFYGELGNGTIPTAEPYYSLTPVTADLGGGGVAGLGSGMGAHNCTWLSSGAVRCWGSNFSGELGDGTSATAAPYGRVPQTVSGISGTPTRVAWGYYMSCASTSNALWCWGNNSTGNIGTGSASNQTLRPTQVSVLGTRRVTDFGAGKNHVCVLTDNGSVWCWGANFDGQLGNGTTVHSAAAVQVKGW